MNSNITDIIGMTPLVRLIEYSIQEKLPTTIFAKIESRNPGGSVKDRVALGMIVDAEESGRLKKGDIIVEPTSGNTGIGLALVGRQRGYRVILTMPETMSVERRKLLAAYGAEIVLTEGAKGMKGAIEEAERICQSQPGSVILGQFTNPANPKTHEQTTGPEIWHDTEGGVTMFVAGIGTGGTISGVGRFLKRRNPKCMIVGVEPSESPVISGGKPGSHGIQGIGAGFIPATHDPKVVDLVVKVSTNQAAETARRLAETENILTGFSGGAALFAATEMARKYGKADSEIVVLLPDGGERYISTGLFGSVE